MTKGELEKEVIKIRKEVIGDYHGEMTDTIDDLSSVRSYSGRHLSININRHSLYIDEENGNLVVKARSEFEPLIRGRRGPVHNRPIPLRDMLNKPEGLSDLMDLQQDVNSIVDKNAADLILDITSKLKARDEQEADPPNQDWANELIRAYNDMCIERLKKMMGEQRPKEHLDPKKFISRLKDIQKHGLELFGKNSQNAKQMYEKLCTAATSTWNKMQIAHADKMKTTNAVGKIFPGSEKQASIITALNKKLKKAEARKKESRSATNTLKEVVSPALTPDEFLNRLYEVARECNDRGSLNPGQLKQLETFVLNDMHKCPDKSFKTELGTALQPTHDSINNITMEPE